MKEIVYINRTKNVENLYAKAKEYFHRHGVEIDFTFVQSDYKNLSYTKLNLPVGQRIVLQPYMAQVIPIDQTYDFTSFVFDQAEFTPPNLPTSFTYCPIKQPFMDMGTHLANPIDLDYVNICHEHMHALVLKANQAGFKVQDVMDTYYHAMELESTDSNFGQQWVLLAPYIHALQAPVSPAQPAITLIRLSDNTIQTLGQLRASDGSFGCDTLELAWKNNQSNTSCIPKGTYQVEWKFMLSELSYHYQILNVPKRTGCFLHAGNYFFNSKGCILVGSAPNDINHDGQIDLTNSKLILAALEKRMNKKPFTLIIK